MLGDDYIAQHCFLAYEEEMKEKLYRYYVSDALYAIANRDVKITKRFSELLEDSTTADDPADEQSAEEIKTNLVERLNKGRRLDNN